MGEWSFCACGGALRAFPPAGAAVANALRSLRPSAWSRVERIGTTLQPAVYVISGPMAAGKSTVARLLASHFERGVHLEGDVFRRAIVSGREEMAPGPSHQALDQLHLRYRLSAAAADEYFAAGFGVALEDVVAGPMLADYVSMIRSRPCRLVVLLPTVEAIVAREGGREHKGYGAWTVEQLYDGFAGETARVGLWLDTTELTPEETVDAILLGTS